MKKISERAIEIMVQRNEDFSREPLPKQFHNIRHVTVEDLAKALDWFQEQMKYETQRAINSATDPRLFSERDR